MTPAWNIIREILVSPFGSFAFVAGVLYLCGWIIAKIATVHAEWKNKQTGIEKLERKVDGILSDLMFIKTSLNVMQSVTPDKRLTKSHSPVSLTKLGHETAEKMKAAERIAKNWEKIERAIDTGAIDKNAYDIQQFCIETATVTPEKFFGTTDLTDIKMFAFNEGRPVAAYGSLLGVMIRDEYFRVKHIPITDVDKNDPHVQES